jgi:hypothetical protein
MFGTSDNKRAQLWRNEAKARHLLDQHGDEAFHVVRGAISEAGVNLKVRWHWRRIEKHLHQIKERKITIS